MSSVDKEAQEKMGDIIYEVLKEEGIVENRAFITDIVSEVLYKAGYRKPPEGEQDLLLTDEKISERWHYFEHANSNDGSWHYRLKVLKALLKAQLTHAEPLIEKRERERIQREYEGEWYLVTDTYCPEWVLKFRQALGGEL